MGNRTNKPSNIIYKSLELDTEEGRGWWTDENGDFFVRSYFTDDNPDFIGDVIMRDATEKAIGSWRKWGNIRMQHNPDRPIGKVIKIGEGDELEWNRYVAKIVDEDAKKLVQAGVLSATSVGIIVLDYDIIEDDDVDYERSPLARVSWVPPIRINEYEMVEMSLVDNPMNEAAIVSGKGKTPLHKMSSQQIRDIVESRAKALGITRGATSYGNLPFAPDDTPWDGSSARDKLAAWASSDGSGDKDKIDWGKYARGFFWFDSEDKENFGAYKLPFASVFDGSVKAVWRGVTAAAGVVSGARGGVDIPEGDIGSVKSHIKKYYSKHGDVVPWEQDNKQSGEGIEDDAPVEVDRYRNDEELPVAAETAATPSNKENSMEVESNEELVDETTVEPELVDPEVEKEEAVEVDEAEDAEPQTEEDVEPDAEIEEPEELDVVGEVSLLVDSAVERLTERIVELGEALQKSMDGLIAKFEEAQAEYVKSDDEDEAQVPTTEEVVEAAKPLILDAIQAEMEKAAPRKSKVDLPLPEEVEASVDIDKINDRDELLKKLTETLERSNIKRK